MTVSTKNLSLHPTRVGLHSETDKTKPALLSFLLTGLVIISSIALIFFLPLFDGPANRYSIDKTLQPDTSRKLILLTSGGESFAERGGCVERPVSLDEVPQHLINALLSIEDRRFYHHFGIDPVGIVRAAAVNHEAGRIVQGGSTITQQLAKLAYLSRAKTLKRKLDEAIIAIWLERHLSKNQILERYLSRAYFGDGCYGLRAAAKNYFEKNVSDLTVAESVYLVSLLKSPSTLRANPDKLHRRQKLVLRAMVNENYLDETEVSNIVLATPVKTQDFEPGAAYADWIEANYDATGGNPTDPIRYRTSFNPELQAIAEKSVSRVLDKYGKKRKSTEAALVAMRTDGRVLAMVGGRDYRAGQFNRATQALRQPGSAFKLFVYLAALRAGLELDMKFPDKPMTIGDWRPENYNKKYRGWVSVQKAFASSINTVAVHLSETVGHDEVIRAARDLGISSPLKSVPSIALGTSEVTLLELTAAYAAIAAEVYPIKPWGIMTRDGVKRHTNIPVGSGEWKLEVGEPLKQLLAATVRYGTARAARLPLRSFGKTGTSQDYRDAWFIGFAGNLIVGVWVGNDDNSSMERVTGGSLPARIWRDFMNKARRTDPLFRSRPDKVKGFPGKAKPMQLTRTETDIFDTVTKPQVKPTAIIRVKPKPKPKPKVNYSTGSGVFGPDGKANWEQLIVN